MKAGRPRNLAIGLVAFLIAGVCLIDASAQRRRRRHKPSAPRITNPAISAPSPSDSPNAPGEPRIISTADEQTSDNDKKRTPAANDDPESMRRTIRTLSSQVEKLADKLSQMEEQQRSLVDLERLSRAEQRAASLRAELRDVQAKEAELQARAGDIDYALQPQNIERAVAGYGTTHPEEAREQRRRQLEAERNRVRAQLDQLANSRAHLQQSIAAADAEAERLRQKLDAADAAALKNAEIKAQGAPASPPAPSPTPSPSPYPPQ